MNKRIKSKHLQPAEKTKQPASKQPAMIRSDFFPNAFPVDISKVFPMIVLATMSSGKSTLVNAMLESEVLPSKNEACTAKVYSILDDDSRNDATLYVRDKLRNVSTYTENIPSVLEKANNSDDITDIFIAGQIKSVLNTDKSLLVIDTPGPNNASDETHEQITMKVLGKVYGGLILYLINATQIGINDDKLFISKVAEHLKKHPRLKIVFVINKIDMLDPEKEPAKMYVDNVRNYVSECGISDPEVIPVSALGANLFRKALSGERLTRLQARSFDILYETFRSRDLRMKSFAVTKELEAQSNTVIVGGEEYLVSDIQAAIDNTGVPYLEHYIQNAQILSSKKKGRDV
ncbi:Dynamin family protein [Ruminococcaceae bacterium FB2012]|nr:Dynamin family protein [Ruminococcaceae bacterium FB2012]